MCCETAKFDKLLKDAEDISEETLEFGEAQDSKLGGWRRALGI